MSGLSAGTAQSPKQNSLGGEGEGWAGKEKERKTGAKTLWFGHCRSVTLDKLLLLSLGCLTHKTSALRFK